MTAEQMLEAGADPKQIRAAHPMISRSKNYDLFLAARRGREQADRMMRFCLSPVTIVCRAVAGYDDELHQLLDGGAVYLGPGN